MNSTNKAGDALRDLFQFHFGSRLSWLPALLIAAAVIPILVLLSKILQVGVVPDYYRTGLALRAAICWAISTVFAYSAGFVIARLSLPNA